MSAAQKLATAFHGERSSIPTISSSEKPANTPRAALYTQHGPSNRLTLSLTSGISEECDFALDRLLRISAIDPSIFLLEHFPGLTEALCTTIDLAPSCTPNPHFQSTHTETRLRQAANAAIVLRNVAAEPDNLLHLWQRPQVLPTLIHTLERTAPFDARVPSHAQLARDTTQLHATLLDIFAVFAPYITLQSSPATTTDDASEADESEEPQRKRQKRLGPVSHHVQSLFPRIYPLVSRLCWSSDRALVISAYYILAALATSLNASTFTFNAHVDTLEAPNPVSRALELLPLNDLDLISATLQFLFCYTDISSKNADSLASRKDILHILRMLLNKSMLAGVRHDMVTGPPKPVSKAKQQAALSGFPKGAGFLPPAEMQLLCMLAEPQRTTLWYVPYLQCKQTHSHRKKVKVPVDVHIPAVCRNEAARALGNLQKPVQQFTSRPASQSAGVPQHDASGTRSQNRGREISSRSELCCSRHTRARSQRSHLFSHLATVLRLK